MGRRRDNPEDQAAKGYPGKRRRKTDRAIELARRWRRLLAEPPLQRIPGKLTHPDPIDK